MTKKEMENKKAECIAAGRVKVVEKTDSGVYEIAIEDDMTKEYAKDLAKKFAK